MMQPAIETSPLTLARLAGALYVLNIVGGAFAIGVVPAILHVTGNAAATAHNIQSNELLFRSSLFAHALVGVTNIPMAVIFYDLLRVVNRRLALMVVLFSVVGTAIESANLLNQYAPLVFLNGAHYSSALSTEQLQALAYAPTVLQTVSYDFSSVFFGFNGLCIGYLVFKSTFLPRVIGALLALGSTCYLVYSLLDIVAPAFASHVVPYVQLPSLVGEASFALWLLIVGLNVRRWTERAAAARLQPVWAP